MALNFQDTKNEITNKVQKNGIIKFIFGNIISVSIIIVLLLFIIIINNIVINTDSNNKTNYTYNISSIFIYSLIVSILSISIHDNIIKEEYLDKLKSKSENEFKDMMIGSAQNLINTNPNNTMDTDIERFLNKQ
jgi:hypothetical protein